MSPRSTDGGPPVTAAEEGSGDLAEQRPAVLIFEGRGRGEGLPGARLQAHRVKLKCGGAGRDGVLGPEAPLLGRSPKGGRIAGL
eukprot:6521788-Lingulodinium_polyedra.AAC.1